MVDKYMRVEVPYAPTHALSNSQIYTNLTLRSVPPSPAQLDAEFNNIYDSLNDLQADVDNAVLGEIPGINDPNNAGKFLAAPGNWLLVGTDNMAPQSVDSNILQPAAVKSPNIDTGAIDAMHVKDYILPLKKMAIVDPGDILAADNAGRITNVQSTAGLPLIGQGNNLPIFAQSPAGSYAPKSIKNPDIDDNCIETRNYKVASITNACMAPLSVTPPNISSSGATAGYPLISQAANAATFAQVPTVGIADAAVTMDKLAPTVSRGIVVAAGRFVLTSNAVDITQCFGITSITYANNNGYAQYAVVLNGAYANPVIVTANQTFIINTNGPFVGTANVSNTGFTLVSSDARGINNGNIYISFQVISIG